MVLVEKVEGEYLVKVPLDLFSLSILLSLTKSDDFKSFVLMDYEYANTNWFDFLGVEYKKLDKNTYLLPGSAVSLIAKDTVKRGKILLCSESYQSLSSKLSTKVQSAIKEVRAKSELRVSSTSSLPVELTIWISEDGITFSFRDKRFVYAIFAFYVYRKLSLIPTEFQVESLSLILSEINITDKTIFRFTKLGKCFLPGKVMLSLELLNDGRMQYFTLTYARNRWSIKPNNSARGALNFLHKFFLLAYDFISGLYDKYIYSRFHSFIDSLMISVSGVLNVYWVKDLTIILFFVVIVFLMLKSKLVFLLVLIYLLWVVYKRFIVFILFRG